MNYQVDGHEVLSVEQVVTPNQTATVRRHHCFAKKLVISGLSTATVNAALPLLVKWQDWQGSALAGETSEINVAITGPAQTAESTLTPVNGQAELELVFPVAGVYKVRASAGFPCDIAELEVTVNE